MPYEIVRTTGKNQTTGKSSDTKRVHCYKVIRARWEKQPVTKYKPRKFSKCTTLKKARAQERLLRALHYNPDFKVKLRQTQRLQRLQRQ